MRILLVSVNNEKIPYPVAPLGMLYIAESLRSSGHTVETVDLCFSENVEADIRDAVESYSPEAVGVSIRNIDNLSYPGIVSYLPHIQSAIGNVKLNTDAPIIIGGSAFSLFPKEILEKVDCSIGIIGEGESAFPEIAKRIELGESDLSQINNVIWKSPEGEFITNSITHADESDFIVPRDLINNKLYSERGGMGNIQTKRGCHFNCCYCTYPLLEGRHYRLRSPEIVAEEVEEGYKRHNINHFFLVDNIFNFPSDHAKEVCKSIISKKLPVEWSCFANPLDLTKDLLDLMKKAGCVNIELGTDALSENVLTDMGKSFTIEDAFDASELCKEAGIKCAHYVMFGGPGETIETLHEAFDNIRKINCAAVIVMVGIRIYPGTPLEERALKDGVITKDDDLLFPHFYLSPEVPLDTMLREVTDFAANDPKCIVPGLGIKSSEKMFEMLRKYFKKGPLWGYLGG